MDSDKLFFFENFAKKSSLKTYQFSNYAPPAIVEKHIAHLEALNKEEREKFEWAVEQAYLILEPFLKSYNRLIPPVKEVAINLNSSIESGGYVINKSEGSSYILINPNYLQLSHIKVLRGIVHELLHFYCANFLKSRGGDSMKVLHGGLETDITKDGLLKTIGRSINESFIDTVACMLCAKTEEDFLELGSVGYTEFVKVIFKLMFILKKQGLPEREFFDAMVESLFNGKHYLALKLIKKMGYDLRPKEFLEANFERIFKQFDCQGIKIVDFPEYLEGEIQNMRKLRKMPENNHEIFYSLPNPNNGEIWIFSESKSQESEKETKEVGFYFTNGKQKMNCSVLIHPGSQQFNIKSDWQEDPDLKEGDKKLIDTVLEGPNFPFKRLLLNVSNFHPSPISFQKEKDPEADKKEKTPKLPAVLDTIGKIAAAAVINISKLLPQPPNSYPENSTNSENTDNN